MMSRADLKAVSPEVTAALMTPKMVMVAMTGVNHVSAITPTMAAQPVKALVTNQLGTKTYTFKVAPGENISAKCVLKVEKDGRIAKINL